MHVRLEVFHLLIESLDHGLLLEQERLTFLHVLVKALQPGPHLFELPALLFLLLLQDHHVLLDLLLPVLRVLQMHLHLVHLVLHVLNDRVLLHHQCVLPTVLIRQLLELLLKPPEFGVLHQAELNVLQ